jgi:predicted ATPase
MGRGPHGLYRSDGELPALPSALRDDIGRRALRSQDAFFRQKRNFLAAVAAHYPILLVLEDLHWADQASLDLLRFLSRQVTTLPVLLVGTYRDDELQRQQPWHCLLPHLVREGMADRITVRRLGSNATRELVQAHYDLSDVGEARLVTYLEHRAEGNPLFIHELLRTLEEEGQLQRAGAS